MGVVAKKVKEMSLDDILAFEKSGEVVISGHSLKLSDIKVYINYMIYMIFLLTSDCRPQIERVS